MLHGSSGVGTLEPRMKDRGATIARFVFVLCKVTEREIHLLTWLLGQVINLPKGSPLASRNGGLVGLKSSSPTGLHRALS